MLLRCQREPYLREETFQVVQCTPTVTPKQPAPTKKGSTQPPPTPKYLALLDLPDSIIFVENGGQPSDNGTVRDCRGVVYQCVGIEHLKSGEVRHTIVLPDASITLPAAGEQVTVTVDWARRYDHMQQHSAQHLFSHLAMKTKGYKTIGWALHPDRTVVELEESDLFVSDVAIIAEQVNDVIRKHVPVTMHIVTHDQLSTIPNLRSRGAVPTEGEIRVISIEGYDASTCCGTHISNTAELQAFIVLGTERVRKGSTRVEFLAGSRAIHFAIASLERDKVITKLLGCNPEAFPERIETLQSEVSQLNKLRKKLTADLAAKESQTLITIILQLPPQESSSRVFYYKRVAGDMEFLQEVETQVRERCGADVMLLMTASESETGIGPGVFVLSGKQDLVQKAAPVVIRELQGKGGGKGARIQGRAQSIEKGEQVTNLLIAELFH